MMRCEERRIGSVEMDTLEPGQWRGKRLSGDQLSVGYAFIVIRTQSRNLLFLTSHTRNQVSRLHRIVRERTILLRSK